MNIQKIAAFASPTENGYQGGNPAGVVLIKEFPSDDEMIAIAAEVGYSETVFAVPIATQTNAYRVRYFSPEGEVPFCGHATIALGAALGDKYWSQNSTTQVTFQLTLNHAQVGLRLDKKESDTIVTLFSPPTSHQVIAKSQDELFGMVKDVTTENTAPSVFAKLLINILEDFNISIDDLDWHTLAPAIVDGGSKHLALTLKSQATLDNMNYDFDAVKQRMLEHDLVTIILALPRQDKNNQVFIDIRNAFASGGVIEDPATGAAAAAYAGYIRDSQSSLSMGITTNKKSEYQLTFNQGRHINMPSVIKASFSGDIGSPIALTGYTRALS